MQIRVAGIRYLGSADFGGAIVSGVSRSQRNLTLSSIEGEYVAMGEVSKEVLFMQSILKCVQPEEEEMCTIVYEGNQGAIQLANNPLSSSNSKHIDVYHHFSEGADREREDLHHIREVGGSDR